jgi:hypothetical protein
MTHSRRSVYLYDADSCLQSLESLQNSEVVVYNLGLSGGSYNVNDSFLDFKSFYVLDLSSNIDIHLDTLQACFASMHFLPQGSLYLRNVFRSGIIEPFSEQKLGTSFRLLLSMSKNVSLCNPL